MECQWFDKSGGWGRASVRVGDGGGGDGDEAGVDRDTEDMYSPSMPLRIVALSFV